LIRYRCKIFSHKIILTGDTERANLFERMFKLLPADDSDSYELLRLSRAAENGEHKSEGESEDESAEDVSLLQADSSIEEDTDGGSEMIQPSDRDVAFGRGLIMGKAEEPCKIVYITNSGKEKFLDSIMIIADQDCQTTADTSKARGAGFSISTQRRILANLPGSQFYQYTADEVWQEATPQCIRDRCKAEYLRAIKVVSAPLIEPEPETERADVSARKQQREPRYGDKMKAFVERSDRDVCFGDPGHPGTIAWAVIVKKKALSKNRRAPSRSRKALFDAIVKALAIGGPRQFLVKSKTGTNCWQVATDKEAFEKTSQKFRSFKHLGSTRKVPSSKLVSNRTTPNRATRRNVRGPPAQSARDKRVGSNSLRGDRANQRREPRYGDKTKAFIKRSDRDVCFRDPGHPGTIAWAVIVKKKALSKNRRAPSRSRKALFDSIVKALAIGGPRQFLVKSNTGTNCWQVATDKEASEKTSQKFRSFKHLESTRKVPSSKLVSNRTTPNRATRRNVRGSPAQSARDKRAASNSLCCDFVQKQPAKRTKVKEAAKDNFRCISECEPAPTATDGMDTQKMILGMIAEECNKVIEASNQAPRDGNLMLHAAVVEQMKEFLEALQNVPWAHAMNERANNSQVDKRKRQGAGTFADCLTQIELEYMPMFLKALTALDSESDRTGPPPPMKEGIQTREMILSLIEDCINVIESSNQDIRDGNLILRAAMAESMKDLLEALQNVPWAHAMTERANDKNEVDNFKRHGAGAVADHLAQIEPDFMHKFLNGLKEALGDVLTQGGS
jgi:hypothetical protein